MFEPVFETLRKTTETSLQMQQEMFKKWVALWPGMVPQTSWGEQAQKFQKKWAETVSEMVKKQNELLETQFKVGLQNLEDSLRLAEAKDVEEMRGKTLELWRKTFDCLRQTFDAQMREFQTAASRWCEVAGKGAA